MSLWEVIDYYQLDFFSTHEACFQFICLTWYLNTYNLLDILGAHLKVLHCLKLNAHPVVYVNMHLHYTLTTKSCILFLENQDSFVRNRSCELLRWTSIENEKLWYKKMWVCNNLLATVCKRKVSSIVKCCKKMLPKNFQQLDHHSSTELADQEFQQLETTNI